jgi:hypothetical protein
VDRCVTPILEREERQLGLEDGEVALLSQESTKKPYRLWGLGKYVSESSGSRKLFWERASAAKKMEIARALTTLRERDDVVVEARMDFHAEQWGLGVPPAEEDGDEEVSLIL